MLSRGLAAAAASAFLILPRCNNPRLHTLITTYSHLPPPPYAPSVRMISTSHLDNQDPRKLLVNRQGPQGGSQHTSQPAQHKRSASVPAQQHEAHAPFGGGLSLIFPTGPLPTQQPLQHQHSAPQPRPLPPHPTHQPPSGQLPRGPVTTGRSALHPHGSNLRPAVRLAMAGGGGKGGPNPSSNHNSPKGLKQPSATDCDHALAVALHEEELAAAQGEDSGVCVCARARVVGGLLICVPLTVPSYAAWYECMSMRNRTHTHTHTPQASTATSRTLTYLSGVTCYSASGLHACRARP